jgi:hypothetical protein
MAVASLLTICHYAKSISDNHLSYFMHTKNGRDAFARRRTALRPQNEISKMALSRLVHKNFTSRVSMRTRAFCILMNSKSGCNH